MISFADLMMRLQFKLWGAEQKPEQPEPKLDLPLLSPKEDPTPHPLEQLQVGDVFYETPTLYPAYPNYVLEREGDRLLFLATLYEGGGSLDVLSTEGQFISKLPRSALTIERGGVLHAQIIAGVDEYTQRERESTTRWAVVVRFKDGHERWYNHPDYEEAATHYTVLRNLWVRSNMPSHLKSKRTQPHFLGEVTDPNKPSATYDFREVSCVALQPASTSN